MKCLVCNKTYDGAECPRCRFPNVQIPGDYAVGIRALQPTIDAYRDTFLSQITIGLVIYYWKDRDGTVVVDREERIPFGNGKELLEGPVWLNQKFARIPDEKFLQIRVYINSGSEEREAVVCVPNLFEAELQEIGISVDNDFNFYLMLKNDTGIPTKSEKVPFLTSTEATNFRKK